MEISEVRVKLMEDSDDRLQGFCSVTFDNCFVVRDLKIIDGANGPFVAMPSRKLTSHCHQCGTKNHLKAQYCNQCGSRLREDRAMRDSEGRAKLYADIAHPINSACREMIQSRVIAEYRSEMERAKQPGYVSRYDDDYDDDVDTSSLLGQDETRRGAPSPTESPAQVQSPGQPSPGQPSPGQPSPGQPSPGQAHPPPPHISPVPSTRPDETSQGGPHFSGPQREEAKEQNEGGSKNKPRGDFGAGIF